MMCMLAGNANNTQAGGNDGDRLLSAMAGAGIFGAGITPAAALQVKYWSGTEPPKLKVPANSCDCHHHIYGSQYKGDRHSTPRPGDARLRGDRAPLILLPL